MFDRNTKSKRLGYTHAELPRLERHGFSRRQIDPIGFAANISEFRNGIVKVLNFDFTFAHEKKYTKPYRPQKRIS